ncbi:hypothetical protein D3C84_1037030 [compost metagenome]
MASFANDHVVIGFGTEHSHPECLALNPGLNETHTYLSRALYLGNDLSGRGPNLVLAGGV